MSSDKEFDELVKSDRKRKERIKVAKVIAWIFVVMTALPIIDAAMWPHMSSVMQETSLLVCSIVATGNVLVTIALAGWFE